MLFESLLNFLQNFRLKMVFDSAGGGRHSGRDNDTGEHNPGPRYGHRKYFRYRLKWTYIAISDGKGSNKRPIDRIKNTPAFFSTYDKTQNDYNRAQR